MTADESPERACLRLSVQQIAERGRLDTSSFLAYTSLAELTTIIIEDLGCAYG